MANLRQEIAVGSTGAEFVAAFEANAKNANIRVYNVEDYGAVHDGVTDDTVAIQLAINTCFAAGGGKVYFPNGTYIIGGALQNDIGADLIDYNSQLYIPATKLAAGMSLIHMEIIGESWSRAIASGTAKSDSGVTLKSTIAGTGVFPSVISGMGASGAYGTINYTVVTLENIRFVVDAFEGTTGASMSGVNFIYLSHCRLKNVTATIDVTDIQNSIEPASNVFGIAVGCVQNDHPIVDNVWASGFTYGLILGEGVLCLKAEIFWCKIGLMFLQANVALNIQWINILGCKYPIASQQETFFAMTAGATHIVIGLAMIECDPTGSRCPTWTIHEDVILDALSRIRGYMDYDMSDGSSSGAFITKSNGGLNLLVRNIYNPNGYHWTTAERTFTAACKGIIGYNTTTNKYEYFDSSSWHTLTVES